MVCSNCGSENPGVNRFCGMCGTPLPQRPITAPGAQSTLDLTRLPINASPTATSTVSDSAEAAPAAMESTRTGKVAATRRRAKKASPVAAQPGDAIATSELAAEEGAFSSAVPGGKNYFTDAEQAESLEQFIAGFHYTPPAGEEELTMTGDKPVLDSGARYQPAAPMLMADDAPATAVKEEPPVRVAPDVLSTPPPMAMPKTPSASPGTSAPAETIPAKPGFLELSDPPAQPQPVPTTIGGPSFLGLSDPDVVATEEVEALPHRSHWRAWLALAIIVLFAGLALLEWRAESRQSNNGPMGVMKMQIERLKGKKGAVVTPVNPTETAPDGTPASTTPASPQNTNPQAAPQQQQPQKTNPAPPDGKAPSPNPGAASNGSQPVTPTTQSVTATGASKAATPAAATEAANAPQRSASTQPGTKGEEEHAKTAGGAEELAKANSASDSAAAAAWLWKAIAKGNPQAPLRLADMYIKGDGVPRNCDQALVLLRAAADEENAAASSRLGTLYATGTCVPRDRVRAYGYLSSAVEANPKAVWARDFRQQLWSQMTPQERNQAQKYR